MSDQEKIDGHTDGFFNMSPDKTRLRGIVIGQRVIRDFLRMPTKDRFFIGRSREIPEDLTIQGAYYSPLHRGWIVICHSETFDPVPEGTMVPDWNPTFEEMEVEKAEIGNELWTLLDAIDTASDAMKPEQNQFYKYVMEKVAESKKILASDGYRICLPSELEE